MQLRWQRGRGVGNPLVGGGFDFGPNLDIIPKVNDTYMNMYAEEADPNQRDGILKAHRNFLRQAIYSLYVYNRISDAAKWFTYLGEKYPDKPILDGNPNSFPRTLTLEQYAIACVQEDINDMSPDRVRTIIEGLLRNSCVSLIMGEDDRAMGLQLLARKAWAAYQSKIPAERR